MDCLEAMPESWGASANVYGRLLAGNKVSSGVSARVILSRCYVFRQKSVKLIPFCGILWVILVFELVGFVCYRLILLRCYVFRQQSVKMSRLSAVDPLSVVFSSIWACRICLLGSYCCQDRFRLSATVCQVVSAVDPILWYFVGVISELVGFVCWGHTVVKMFHLSATVCQDVSSFGSCSHSTISSGCYSIWDCATTLMPHSYCIQLGYNLYKTKKQQQVNRCLYLHHPTMDYMTLILRIQELQTIQHLGGSVV